MATVVAAQPRRQESNRAAGVLAACTAVVLAVAYLPMLVKFFIQQWQQPQYQHFPFILAAFGWLLWSRIGQAEPKPAAKAARSSWLPWCLLGLAWLSLALSFPANSPWLAIVSAASLVAWGCLEISRRWDVPYLGGVWLVLLLVIPLPLHRDQQLISWLQYISSRVSSFVLDWLGVCHLMEGNALLLTTKQFFVDEACSGIISVMSIIACAVIYGVWRNRPPFHLALLILAGVCWATMMNMFRIVTIAFVYDRFGLDWSVGTPHELISLVVFTITFLGLISTDLAIEAFVAPIAPVLATQSGVEPTYGRGLIRLWDRVRNWRKPRRVDDDEPTLDAPSRASILASGFTLPLMAIVAFGLLAGLQWVVNPLLGRSAAARETHALDRALALADSALPQEVGALARTRFAEEERDLDSAFGRYSRSYDYREGEGPIFVVSCDFPFGPSWHDLRECYRGVGWELVSGRVVQPPDADQPKVDDAPWEYVETEYKRPDGAAAYVIYSCFTELGDPVNPPTGSLLRDVWSSLWRQRQAASGDRFYQIQVSTTADVSVGEKQKNEAARLLGMARERFRRQIGESTAEPQQTTDAASSPASAPAAVGEKKD